MASSRRGTVDWRVNGKRGGVELELKKSRGIHSHEISLGLTIRGDVEYIYSE